MRSGAFQRRNKEVHQSYITKAQEKGESCFAVKGPCVLTQSVSHFNVISGYPPDIIHDVFGGIVPVEPAQCIAAFISKKFFTFVHIINLIQLFSYPSQVGDKTGLICHQKPCCKKQKKNWCLLRLIPLMVGRLIPDDEPAWQWILDLKDIVELVVAPIHCGETIDYLEFKITLKKKVIMKCCDSSGSATDHEI